MSRRAEIPHGPQGRQVTGGHSKGATTPRTPNDIIIKRDLQGTRDQQGTAPQNHLSKEQSMHQTARRDKTTLHASCCT